MDSTSSGSPVVAADGVTVVDGPADHWGEDNQEPPDSGGGDWRPRAAEGPYPAPFFVPEDGVTRQLCASAHLNANFANYVHDELVEPAYQAMAPNWNLDTITLARHAEQSRQRRETRDRRLLLELLAVIVIALVSAECAVGGVFDGRLTVTAIPLVVAVALVLIYAVAFAIVWDHYSAVHRSAVAVIGVPGVEAVEPDALAPEIEESLQAAENANVVLFTGASPFVGSGTLLDHWTIAVDISTGTATADGERAQPEQFDSCDLHEALLAALPESMNPRPAGGLRLYVVGGHAVAVGELFRSGPVTANADSAIRFRRPVTVVPPERIEGYLREPHVSARPYTYFELTGWDGQVVVTLFIRTVVNYPLLLVETSICALRPPRGEFGDVGTIPLGPGVHRLPVLRSVLPMAIPLLLNSLARAYDNLRGGHDQKVARKELELVLARRADVNFAAGPSLREGIAGEGNGNHFGFVDEEMYYRMFSRRSLDCLRDFLVARQVDVGEFDKQQAIIAEKTLVKAQTIYGSAAIDAG